VDQSSHLRKCSSCGEGFAKSVEECPHCGKKVQDKANEITGKIVQWELEVFVTTKTTERPVGS
jgi:anaerobic ribonucleoside-triphosphate reductase